MTKRIISALIGAPLLLIVTWLGGWYLSILVVILALLGLREFLYIGRKAGFIIRQWPMVVFCTIWLIVFVSGLKEWLLPLGVVWLMLTLGSYALRYPNVSLEKVAYSFLALIYPVFMFTFLESLRGLPDGLYWCFFVFAMVWLTDTGAFFVGITLGKHKLVPKVSPNKSVEGAIGGLAMALISGLAFWLITDIGSLPGILVLSLLTSMVSQIGDLFESALKRTAGVKDSGKLIPGHGGILDRFDSFLFALPLVYYAIQLGIVY
ncbi:phosphatidate cytidylyltransferase [Dehalobacter sp. DCM]|uniref:phosphatidate cytidylyltransferase n=1 Tax=Dehalobacter sp. DCM TaxID=2907827 RepID=UPI00308177BA|nr:phosphatidate cytidylyltransferase [Dehalobacter sp. DCM]